MKGRIKGEMYISMRIINNVPVSQASKTQSNGPLYPQKIRTG
jgi:uncharacterized protein YcsI (UPF0317 family)